MASRDFNLNNHEVVELANRLEKLHKSAAPVAVRQTLNTVAFIGRRESLKRFGKDNIIRNRLFIRSHNIVNRSPNTFEISKMNSEFGIIKNKSFAGNNMDDLEFGASITNRDMPTRSTRKDKVIKNKISPGFYKKFYKNKSKGVIYKSGESKIIKTKDRLLRIKRGGAISTLYIFNASFNIKKRPFVSYGGEFASKSLVKVFRKHAVKRFEKYLRK